MTKHIHRSMWCLILFVVVTVFVYYYMTKSSPINFSFITNIKLFQREGDNNNNCTLVCYQEMRPKFVTVFGNSEMIEEFNTNPNAYLNLTKHQFRNLCQNVINRTSDCINNCRSNNLVSKVISKALEPSKVICTANFDDIYNNYECLQKAYNISKRQCVDEKCKSFKHGPALLIRESQKLTNINQFHNLKSLFIYNCQFHTCVIPCQKPIVEKMCGKHLASVTQHDLIRISMQSSKQILTLINKLSIWPEQCDKVINAVGMK